MRPPFSWTVAQKSDWTVVLRHGQLSIITQPTVSVSSGLRTLDGGGFYELRESSCGGGDGSVTPAPTVTLGVSPTSVAAYQTAMLTWSSTNAQRRVTNGPALNLPAETFRKACPRRGHTPIRSAALRVREPEPARQPRSLSRRHNWRSSQAH